MKHELVAHSHLRYTPWIAAACATVLAAVLLWPRLYPIDDAYITLSNARILLSGESDRIFGSSYLTGATSPVHLLLVAAAALVVDPLWAPLVVGLIGAVLYVLALSKTADQLAVSGLRKAVVLAIGVLNGNAVFHYLNGLETSVSMAAASWMIVWRDDRRKLPLLAGVAPFIRPELGLLGALLVLRIVLRCGVKHSLVAILVAVAASLPFMVWLMDQTGQLLPSTIAAKLAWFRPEDISVSDRALLSAYWLAASLHLPLFAGFAGLPKLHAGIATGAFVLTGVVVSAAVMPNILDWNFGRYSAVYVPILAFGILGIARDRRMAANALIAILFVFAVASAAVGIRSYVREIEYAREVQHHAKLVARLPPSSRVLIHDAGQVAWENPRGQLIDIVGLKTPAVVPIHQSLTLGDCRRTRSLDRIARIYAATHLVVINRLSWPCVADDMRDAGWRLEPIYHGLYTIYRLHPGPTSSTNLR